MTWTFNNIRPDEALDKYTHAELVLHLRGKRIPDDVCKEKQNREAVFISTSVSTWSEIYGVRRKIEGVPECWDAFDLSQIFDIWRTESTDTNSMYVSLHLPSRKSELYDLYGFDELYEPLLVLYTHDPSEMEAILPVSLNSEMEDDQENDDKGHGHGETRFKRSLGDDSKNMAASVEEKRDGEESEPCALKPWYVTFAELGWGDWIITPRGINANYCQGSCEVVRNMTNHAFVKKVFLERHGRRGLSLPNAYCVPTKIQPMSILFSTNGTIFLKQMPEMKVEACGCL